MTHKKGRVSLCLSLFSDHGWWLDRVHVSFQGSLSPLPWAWPLWPVPSGRGPSQFSFPSWVTWSLWNARPAGGILSMTMPVYGGQGYGAWGMSGLGRRNANPGLPLTKWVLRANAAFVFQSHHRELGRRSGIVCLTRMCKAWVPPWPLKKKK